MNNMDLGKPTRQSIKGLVLIFIQELQQSIRMFWPMVLFILFQNKFLENKLLLGLGGILILVLLIIHSILYYLNFYFYLTKGEFILKKGYLKKKILTIPLDRIQNVNMRQNLVQQILDVVTLEIDTAGTASKELKIHALEKTVALEIQNQLRSGKLSDGKNLAEQDSEFESEKLVLRLSPFDLFKIGISQNHIRTALIILAFGFQIFQKVQDLFEEKAEQYSNEVFEFVSGSNWAFILFLLIFFLLVSILYSLISTVIKYFEFKLYKKDKIYRIESGLINKRNVTIPFNKVQELNWNTGPIKKQFGIYNLVFKQAVSGQSRKNQLVDAPGCLSEQLELLKTDIFGKDELHEASQYFTDNYYFRRLWIISGWIPAILLASFFFKIWYFWILIILWLVLSAGYSFLMLRKRYFRINKDQIRISKGAISHKWKQMELYKIQSVEFRQTIFQKRRSLATLQLMNASGSMSIPYIQEELAKEIYNYLLYHTEISEKSWM